MTVYPDYYKILGIKPSATPDEIRRAYHEAARRFHPDVSMDPDATELFLQIQRAYELLIDPKQREAYDREWEAIHRPAVDAEFLYSREQIPIIDEPQLIYAMLNFSGQKKPEATNIPPLNLCLVLDRSTSMQGERMDTVKAAAIEWVRQLQPQDILSIVIFHDRAEVLVPAGAQQDRSLIETQIRMIRPGGGTEIYQGLETGFAEVRRYANRTLINHMILITDGRTYGDEEECLRLAEQASSQGIRISGLGIGSQWNDVFIDELTGRTGGSSTYISHTRSIKTFLKEKFDSLRKVYAERTRLQLEPGKGVTLNAAFRIQPDASPLPLSAPIHLGSIPVDNHLTVVLELVVQPFAANVERSQLMTGFLECVLVSDPNQLHRLNFDLSRPTTHEAQMELPPRPLFQAISNITLYRMQERARQDVAEGKIKEASQRLQRLATQLISAGEKELAQTALAEADRIQQTHTLSPDGSKLIKYGTRLLLLPAKT